MNGSTVTLAEASTEADALTEAIVQYNQDPSREALADIAEEARPALVLYFSRGNRAPGIHEADDMADETLIRAMEQIHEFDSLKGNGRQWLFGLARNVMLETARHSKRRRVDSLSGDAGSNVDVVDPDSIDLELGDNLDQGNRVEAFRMAVQGLPPRMRETVELRLQDHSSRQIAELQGVTVGTVDGNFSDAKDRLRAHPALSALRNAM